MKIPHTNRGGMLVCDHAFNDDRQAHTPTSIMLMFVPNVYTLLGCAFRTHKRNIPIHTCGCV